jgi:threonine/homoserine/homoserine lactone efflux protein
MLTFEQTLLYLPAVAIIIAIPGPDLLLSISRGLTGGRTAGGAHALGVGVGIMLHSLLAALGVSTLLTASETAFWIMKLVGGGYLIYLGVAQWRSTKVLTSIDVPPAPMMQIFWRGVLSNALNPKVALFVLAFIPQFVVTDTQAGSPFVQMLLLGAIFSLLTIIAYAALGAARAASACG